MSVEPGAPTLRLADLRGQVVLVEFWGTYCGSCLTAFPELDQLHREFGPRGLRVVAVTDEKRISAETIARVAREAGASFEILRVDSKVFEDYLAHGVPISFLIGRGGKIVARSFGISPREPHSRWLTRAGRAEIEEALHDPRPKESSGAPMRVSWAAAREK